MALQLDHCTLKGYEVRARNSGTSAKGTVWHSLKVESPDGEQNEISVRDEGLWESCINLAKGTVCNFDVTVSVRPTWSACVLAGVPVIVSGEVDY